MRELGPRFPGSGQNSANRVALERARDESLERPIAKV